MPAANRAAGREKCRPARDGILYLTYYSSAKYLIVRTIWEV